ncbi:MAG: hypothetical protein ACHQET_00005, partial [Chitinophagales bacterium]
MGQVMPSPLQPLNYSSGPKRFYGADYLSSHTRINSQQSEQEQFTTLINNRRTGILDDSYILPVVFHIISETPQNITDQQIQDALKDLNDAFARTGIYGNSNGANTRIQFCLAQKDPEGGSSNGITRTTSYFANMDQDLEDDRLKNLIIWDPKRYINIW